MDRYRELQVFDAVVRAGSLAAGAQALGLSVATVMRTVAALEARLQVALLLRGPRGVSLSPAGEGFAARCTRLLAAVEKAERSVAGMHAHPNGQLVVSAPLLMSEQLLVPIAVEFLAVFPQVQLEFRTREDIPQLLQDGIDIALVVGELPSSSAFALPVGRVKPVACASPAYLARHGRPQVPQDLRDHQVVASPGSDWRYYCGDTPRNVRLAPRLACATRHGAIQAALAGVGLARCLSYEAHGALRAGQLETVLDGFAGNGLPAHLIYREGRRAAARVRTFLDFFTPRLRAHPALRG